MKKHVILVASLLVAAATSAFADDANTIVNIQGSGQPADYCVGLKNSELHYSYSDSSGKIDGNTPSTILVPFSVAKEAGMAALQSFDTIDTINGQPSGSITLIAVKNTDGSNCQKLLDKAISSSPIPVTLPITGIKFTYNITTDADGNVKALSGNVN